MSEMSPLSFSKSKTQLYLFWLLVMSAAALFRLVNLGQLGLWGDEGYSALSAQAILEYGYPRLPSGGIYPRSLAFLYLEALSVLIFGLNEFALRFPVALMGLAVIWISYKLSKRLFGESVALVVVVLMAFSGWEIEFSRTARMYIFFQFFFLLSIYVFYRGCIEGEKRHQWFIIPVWAFTIFVHQLSITLLAILLIPFFIRNLDLKKKCALFTGFFLVSALWVCGSRLQRYLRFGVSSANQSGGGSGQKLPIATPPTDLIETVIQNGGPFFFILVSLALGLVLFLIYQSFQNNNQRIKYLYLSLMIITSFLNQIALTLVFVFGYTFLFFKDLRSWREKPFLIACAICLSGFFFWLIWGLSEGLRLSKILSLTLQYPYLKDRFLKYYLPGWPLEMLFASLGSILLWQSVILHRKKEFIFALFSFIGPILLLSFTKANDNSARYSFHLFPFLLMFEAYAILFLGNKFFAHKKRVMVPVFLFLLFFILADTRLNNIGNMVLRNYGDPFERPIPMSKKSYTFYPDYKSTSHYIKNHLSAGDLVVSMRELIPFYYIQKMDYIWTGGEKAQFSPLLNDTNAVLINNSEIFSLLSNDETRNIWFLSDPFRIAKLKKKRNKDALMFLSQISNCIVYRGFDGKTTVSFISSNRNCLPR